MKRLVAFLAVLLLAGVVSSALACGNEGQNCNGTLSQKITIKVPSRLLFIMDQTGKINSSKLGDWTVNLAGSQPNFNNTSCYVVPNWVDETTALEWVRHHADHLLMAQPGFGYPPILTYGGKVVTWQYVAEHPKRFGMSTDFTLYSKYTNGKAHKNAHAKGNLVCTNNYAFEVYSNCTGTDQLTYKLQGQGSESDKSGFGTIHYLDLVTRNGSSLTAPQHKNFTHTGQHITLIDNVLHGVYYDNAVSQILWLGSSTEGNYNMMGVYTLGNPNP